jgi:hypothetical protein
MIDLAALTDEELAALVDAARRAYRADRFPLSPRPPRRLRSPAVPRSRSARDAAGLVDG